MSEWERMVSQALGGVMLKKEQKEQNEREHRLMLQVTQYLALLPSPRSLLKVFIRVTTSHPSSILGRKSGKSSQSVNPYCETFDLRKDAEIQVGSGSNKAGWHGSEGWLRRW